MATLEHGRVTPTSIDDARKSFRPDNMGFKKFEQGWEMDIRDVGPVVFLALDSGHAQAEVSLNDHETGSALELLSRMHQEVFQTTDRDAIAPYQIGDAIESGGSVIVAYRKDIGFNHNGWLGFGIVQGGDKQKALSKFIGVRDGYRNNGIGPAIRAVQMHEALEKRKTKFKLDIGPLRAGMANQSIKKLGGTASEFVPDKHHGMNYGTYGPKTDDRIQIVFDLLNPKTQAKMRAATLGLDQTELQTSPEEVQGITQVRGGDELQKLLSRPTLPDRLIYEIPEDADSMNNSRAKGLWRDEMVEVFGALLTTTHTIRPSDAPNDISRYTSKTTKGKYTITDFVIVETPDNDGKNRKIKKNNFYVLTRNDLVAS